MKKRTHKQYHFAINMVIKVDQCDKEGNFFFFSSNYSDISYGINVCMTNQRFWNLNNRINTFP
jgi:hypothetical protein